MSRRLNPLASKLAAVLVLSGCASVPQHLTEESKMEIKNVAIVSLVPESVSFDKIGITSFSSRYTEFNMGSGVTDNILSVSRQRITKSNPDWTIKNVAYDQASLLKNLKPEIGFRSSGVKEAFTDLARNNELDAIFVI